MKVDSQIKHFYFPQRKLEITTNNWKVVKQETQVSSQGFLLRNRQLITKVGLQKF